MKEIKWGIIGCGDVAERKSGPAFQTVPNSTLVAVMRRDAAKAADFAKRHMVPNWYSNAEELLSNSEINAVYIATPPASHLEYTLQALKHNKHVYLEKPMTLNQEEARQIKQALNTSDSKVTVAHYRRRLPAFCKVKELVSEGVIGKIHAADIQILQSKNTSIVAQTDDNWRLDPAISGGGYFHDLAPHQIDFMYYLFGAVDAASGFSSLSKNNVATTVNGIINFKNGSQFRGLWCFNISEASNKDNCTLHGEHGKISFSFYGDKVLLFRDNSDDTIFNFKNPEYVQEPMIKDTVAYFLGKQNNPCSVNDGLEVMKVMDTFTK